MSAADQPHDPPAPWSQITTHVYDAGGNWISSTEGRDTTGHRDGGRTRMCAEPARRAADASAPSPPEPQRVEIVEFRLGGSEAAERAVLPEGPGPWLAATRSVRAYLTRDGAAPAACSAMGGIEIDTAVRNGAVVRWEWPAAKSGRRE